MTVMKRVILRNKRLYGRYCVQRADAGRRGVAFELTFEQWLLIWKQSGHLHERGNRRGQYVMARHGDRGPYAVGNVRIALVEENCSERKPDYYWLGRRHSAASLMKMRKAKLGKKPSVETRRRMSEVRKAFHYQRRLVDGIRKGEDLHG